MRMYPRQFPSGRRRKPRRPAERRVYETLAVVVRQGFCFYERRPGTREGLRSVKWCPSGEAKPAALDLRGAVSECACPARNPQSFPCGRSPPRPSPTRPSSDRPGAGDCTSSGPGKPVGGCHDRGCGRRAGAACPEASRQSRPQEQLARAGPGAQLGDPAPPTVSQNIPTHIRGERR